MKLEGRMVAAKRTLELDGVEAGVLLVLVIVFLEEGWGWTWTLGLECSVVELVLRDVCVEKGSEEVVVVNLEGLVMQKALEGFIRRFFGLFDWIDLEVPIVFGATAIEGHMLLIFLLQKDSSHMMFAIDSKILRCRQWNHPFLLFFGHQYLSDLLLLSLSKHIILNCSKRPLFIPTTLPHFIHFAVIIRHPLPVLNDKMQQKLMLLLCELIIDHLHQSLEEFFFLVVFFYLFLGL